MTNINKRSIIFIASHLQKGGFILNLKSKYLVVIFIIILIFSLTACADNNADSKLLVAVTIAPQKNFVEAVGGKKVEVVTMIPPGNSPGNYAPSPKEYIKFSDADIYFSIGVPADKVNILPRTRDFNEKIEIIRLDEEVAKKIDDRYFAPGKRDPHIWLSPERVKVMIDIIAIELSEKDKEHADFYQENAKKYKSKLNKVDNEIKDIMQNLNNKSFIVYHPSFGYFADEYGLEMIAIEKDGKEATAKRLQEIIDRARKENIKVVFYQKEIDSRQSEAIAEEIGGKTVQIEPLAEDYLNNLKKMAGLFKEIFD